MKETKILGYTLKLTCGACPEQYDAYDSEGKLVGYLRLRHGYFRADYPDCGEETVYDAYPNGDGCFEDDEREYYLTEAVKALDARHNRMSLSDNLQWVPVSDATSTIKIKGEVDSVAMRIVDLDGNAHYFSSSKEHLVSIAKDIISMYG